MCKKLIYLVSFVLLLGLASSASASLVAYWQLDNDATDSAGGINGTLMNGAEFGVSAETSEEGGDTHPVVQVAVTT